MRRAATDKGKRTALALTLGQVSSGLIPGPGGVGGHQLLLQPADVVCQNAVSRQRPPHQSQLKRQPAATAEPSGDVRAALPAAEAGETTGRTALRSKLRSDRFDGAQSAFQRGRHAKDAAAQVLLLGRDRQPAGGSCPRTLEQRASVAGRAGAERKVPVAAGEGRTVLASVAGRAGVSAPTRALLLPVQSQHTPAAAVTNGSADM